MHNSQKTTLRRAFQLLWAALVLLPSVAHAVTCSSVNINVTRESSPVLYFDPASNQTPKLDATYVQYAITNNTGSAIQDLWVKLQDFSGGQVSLPATENGVTHVGFFAAGATKNVYFLVGVAGVGSNQSHNVGIYTSNPDAVSNTCLDSFVYSTLDAIAANSNKVTAMSISPNPPQLGGSFNIQVTGDSGTVGGAKVFSTTPSAVATWLASAFELTNVSIVMTGGNTGTVTNDLYFILANAADTHYVTTFTFRAKGPTGSNTTLYPVSYINSGVNIKHTDTGNLGSLGAIQPVANSVVLGSMIAGTGQSPNCIGGTGGTSLITLPVTNSGANAVTLDDIQVTLPSSPGGMTLDNTYTATFDGVALPNAPVISGSNVTWYNAFTIPAGTTKNLEFQVNIPVTNGGYAITAVGHIDTTVIGTRSDTSNSAPASVEICVGPTPTPTNTPTQTPTFTQTPSHTPTSTATPTASHTPTVTTTPTATTTPSATSTMVSTNTPTSTPVVISTSTATVTPTPASGDSDDDGIPDSDEGRTDTDGDGIIDRKDIDSDNDGIPDSEEGSSDDDGDGIPNSKDLDSDNDGIPDIIEGGGEDKDGDGRADDPKDSDGDGLSDEYDRDSGGKPQPTPDTDRDGKPDYRDVDSDNDGLKDLIEGQTDDKTRQPSGRDRDKDGIDDAFDFDQGGRRETFPPNSDRTGKPDYRDTDSDDDGTPDNTEGFDFDGDGNPDVTPSGIDADNDGVDDAYENYNKGQFLSRDWRTLPGIEQCSRKRLSAQVAAVSNPASILNQRVSLFAAKCKACGGSAMSDRIARAAGYYAELSSLLSNRFEGNVYRCPSGICKKSNSAQAKAKMLSLAAALAAEAKAAKVAAIVACKTPPSSGDDPRSNTDDYLAALVAGINGLPRSVTRCGP